MSPEDRYIRYLTVYLMRQEGYTLREIATVFGVSHVTIWRMEQDIIAGKAPLYSEITPFVT